MERNLGLDPAAMSTGLYCAPLDCVVTVVPSDMGIIEFLESYTNSPTLNITLTQFAAWNPPTNLQMLTRGEVVRIGYVFANNQRQTDVAD